MLDITIDPCFRHIYHPYILGVVYGTLLRTGHQSRTQHPCHFSIGAIKISFGGNLPTSNIINKETYKSLPSYHLLEGRKPKKVFVAYGTVWIDGSKSSTFPCHNHFFKVICIYFFISQENLSLWQFETPNIPFLELICSSWGGCKKYIKNSPKLKPWTYRTPKVAKSHTNTPTDLFFKTTGYEKHSWN